MKINVCLFVLIFLTPILFSQESKSIKFITYNVLADQVEVEKRVPEIFKILKASDADIIALQEVAPWFLELLLKEPWVKNYQMPKVKDEILVARGLLLLSKTPITNILADFLPSRQHRGYIIIETKINNLDLKIGTCHLDSLLEDGAWRAQQLDVFFKLLNTSENAVLLGDFNFGDAEQPETTKIPADYIDVWLATNKDKAGFTWDIEKSEMAKKGSFPKEKSRRIDRILIKSKSVKPSAAKIVGDIALDQKKELFPSDHFGLFGSVTFLESKFHEQTIEKNSK
jgi:endonuclease/exonuclease/phosphatase family metal-dependent hydrolase